MNEYEITFTTVIGGAMTERVTANSREIAVAKATVAAVRSLEDMTREFGALFDVEFGEATEGFALGLEDGTVTITVAELGA